MIKHSKMTLFLFVIFLPAIFFSCKSTDIPIPGQGKIILENVHIEYVKLGDSYFSLEKYNEAINCYKIASEDKSLYWPCYYKIAKSYVLLSDWNNSLSMFEKLLEKDPENSSLKASLAYIYSMTGDYKSALTLYNDIISVQPNNEKYKENYLAIMLANKDIFIENRTFFEDSFNEFKKNYPENKNITIFQTKYDDFVKEIDKNKEEKNASTKSNEN